MLLLANNGFSRVPVLTKDKKYVGTISMSDIVKYQKEEGVDNEKLAALDISYMTNGSYATVSPNADLTEVMHKLVDANFLPVVEADGTFLGIITRKTILKALNNLLHEFTNDYTLTKK